MSENIKVSVILPIYKVENYLRQCIDSVLAQTLKDIEIILATDGPLACDEICEEYAKKDERIKIILHPGSYGKAINEGVKIARGEYIGIVETDDTIAPDMYKKLYLKAKKTDADMVKCGWYNSFEFDKKHNEILFAPEMDIFNITKDDYLISSQPSVWSAIYKKEFLEINDIKFIEDRISFIDTPFHIETLLKAKKIVALHEPLYFYNQDNPEQSVKNKDKIKDAILGEKFLYNKLLKNDKKLYDKYLEILIFTTVKHLIWNYERISKQNKQIYWDFAKDFVATLNLDNLNYRYFPDYEKKFLHSLINFKTWKDFEKYKANFYELKLLNVPVFQIEEVTGENGINMGVRNFYYKLFNMFSILRKKIVLNREIYYLFNFIPLYKIRKTYLFGENKEFFLFGLIPLFKTEVL